MQMRLLLFTLVPILAAQQVVAPPKRVEKPIPAIQPVLPAKPLRILMEDSIQKQKEAIRKQVGESPDGDSDWFLVPWSRDKDGRNP